MPSVRATDADVKCIVLSDIHLTLRPPVARSAEPNWLTAQARPLHQVHDIAAGYAASGYAAAGVNETPIVVAGDIFDHWHTSPELINWAIRNMPRCYAIPGQHDMPLHNYADIHKSAFWTLVEAGVVTLIPPYPSYLELPNGVVLHGFPWGVPVVPLEVKDPAKYHLAVIHAYIWRPDACYPDAPVEQELGAWHGVLRGYNAAVFGDNHKGFDAISGECYVMNCGGLQRRKSDEVAYRPAVGLVTARGIARHFLDCSADLFIADAAPTTTAAGQAIDLSSFVTGLSELGDTALDYCEAVRRYASNTQGIRPGVASLLLRSIGGSHAGG